MVGGRWLAETWKRAGLVGSASATEFVGDDTPMARFGAVRRRRVDPVGEEAFDDSFEPRHAFGQGLDIIAEVRQVRADFGQVGARVALNVSMRPITVAPTARIPMSSGVTVGSLVSVYVLAARVVSTVARLVEPGTISDWLVVGGVSRVLAPGARAG